MSGASAEEFVFRDAPKGDIYEKGKRVQDAEPATGCELQGHLHAGLRGLADCPEVIPFRDDRRAGDGSNGATLAGILNVIFLELPKLPPVDERTDIESLPSAVKWGTFIKEADNPEKQDLIDRLTRSEKGIMGAQAVLRKMDEDGWRFFEEGQRIVDCIDRNTALNNAERRGIAKGREEDIRNLMANLSLSAEQAMDALGIPADERDKYSALLA